MRLFPILFLAAVLCGCVTAGSPDEGPRSPYGPLHADKKELIAGRYRALGLGNNVVVYAVGKHPSTDWAAVLEVERPAGGETVLALYGESPSSWGLSAGQMIVPFVVSNMLKAEQAKVIRVRDSAGVHDVPVEPPPELLDLEMGRPGATGGTKKAANQVGVVP